MFETVIDLDKLKILAGEELGVWPISIKDDVRAMALDAEDLAAA